MLESIKQRLGRDDEQGFTLIELMVVVLIIAILLAIAIPTFLGARNQANARAAQSNLRNALTSEHAYFTNNQAFGDQTVMPAVESNLTWAAADVATRVPSQVDVSLQTVGSNTSDAVLLLAYGKDGKCYTIAQLNEAGTAPSTATAGTYYNVNNPSSGVCGFPTVPGAPATNDHAGSHVGTGWYTGW
jgi:type IV pilus assembly protein PilA